MQTKGQQRPINAPLPHRPAHIKSIFAPHPIPLQTRSLMPLTRQLPPTPKPRQILRAPAPNIPHLQLNGNLPFQATEVSRSHRIVYLRTKVQ